MRRHRGRRRRLLGTAAGLLVAFLVPALAAAHPLGNFTINHYTGIRVEPDRILLDVVIDQAEIPTFQARLGFDTDGDGEVSDTEAETGRITACTDLQPALALDLNGAALPLTLTDAGLTFPAGVGGLSTMRIVCGFESVADSPLADGSRIAYADRSFADRLGWREIVVEGSAVTLEGSDAPLRTSSPSERLTRYPTNLLAQALADSSTSFTLTAGGAVLQPRLIPDAGPIEGPAGPAESPSPAPGGVVTPATPRPGVAAAVPGGVTSGDLPSIFRTADLTPIVLLASILAAAALGAGHALTPGHGKTLMAAYLVGTRGTPLHAAGLGLSVTVSHTLGILGLAALVVGAGGILPPDLVVKIAPIVAALSIVAIGGWMLIGEGRRRWRARAAQVAQAAHDRAHATATEHDHPHEHPHEAQAEHGGEHEHDHPHDHDHAQDHDHTHNERDRDDHAPVAGEHSHGGFRHSHLPAADSTISWRSLFVLGLAGGLIPSTSALLILLGSIAAGRPAFGIVLVIAFGLGMALVMSGIGLVLVLARGRLDRVAAGSRLGRASAFVPLVAAFLVFGLGLYLTAQAVAGNATF